VTQDLPHKDILKRLQGRKVLCICSRDDLCATPKAEVLSFTPIAEYVSWVYYARENYCEAIRLLIVHDISEQTSSVHHA
jgi:hypothetical protein